MMSAPDPIYVNLDTEDPCVTQIESLCMRCHGKGVTKLLLTKIPHYKEIILTSFECNDCGDQNNGVQSSSVQDHGVRYELQVNNKEDLSRQVVKSNHASLIIPDLDFEVPADGERGDITTVEGVIARAIAGLNQDQEARKAGNDELFQQIHNFIIKLENLLELSNPFTLIVDDPTGNSFIEYLQAPLIDPQLKRTTYERTNEQNRNVGHYEADEDCNSSEANDLSPITEEEHNKNLTEEVLQFNTICDQCSRPSQTKMKVVQIPLFKEVVIMASECSSCGYKTNEVKSGGGIEKKAKKFTLHIQCVEDLARDVLKSETCSISIPILELDVGAGIFVGKFTTIEGLLTDIKDDLLKNPFCLGDATTGERKQRMEKIVRDIEQIIEGKMEADIILDDSAGNSFVQDRFIPEKDPFLVTEEYERSFEQNEELGLNDMITENYF